MVFTGDHLNKPPMIEYLEGKGVLTRERADDLRQLPLQDCDVLLHEAGPPPIHTPLEVLMQLPERVKKRLYVVHTSALPDDCELRVAPAGTAGTIRLDRLHTSVDRPAPPLADGSRPVEEWRLPADLSNGPKNGFHETVPYPIAPVGQAGTANGEGPGHDQLPPLVFLRPTTVSDAWFILNLLSNVPFLTR